MEELFYLTHSQILILNKLMPSGMKIEKQESLKRQKEIEFLPSVAKKQKLDAVNIKKLKFSLECQ